MTFSFKLKGLRSYLIAGALTALLTGAVGTAVWSNFQPNPPPQLWAVDNTVWTPVATNSDAATPTRDNPVWIEASVERLYGWHIGTPIHVRYKIVALNSVKMRFETLYRGILSRYKTTWRTVEPPRLISEEKKEGYTTRILEMTVAVWEPPAMPDSVPQGGPTNFLPPPASGIKKAPVASSPESAAAKAPATAAPTDGAQAQPDQSAPPPEARLWPFAAEFIVSTDERNNPWTYIETPPINFGFASLLEPDADQHGLDFGPLTDVPDHPNRVGVALVNAGYLVTAGGVFYLGLLFVGWWRRRKLPRVLPAEVVRFRSSLAAAEQARYQRSHLEQLRIAVRDFLGGATLPDADLLKRFDEQPKRDMVGEMLETLKRAVAIGRISSFEESRVVQSMNSLIEDRLALDAPAPTRLMRLGASIKVKSGPVVRFLKPIGKVSMLPSALRHWRRR